MLRLLLFFIFFNWSAIGQEIANKPVENQPVIEHPHSTHDDITTRLHYLANSLDSIFADKRADDEFGRSSMRFTQNYTIREESLPKEESQFRFNLKLPHLQRMFNFHAENKKNKEEEAIKSKSLKNVIKESDPWRTNFDTGIGLALQPTVFARGRIRKNWTFTNLIPRFVYELGWFSNLGIIQTTSMNIDRKIKKNVLFRFVNETNWNLSFPKFFTSHGPSLLISLRDYSAISFNIRASSKIIDQVWYFHNYSISTTYRHNLTENWLFAEITPGLDFPKILDFRRSPFILFRLEALFG